MGMLAILVVLIALVVVFSVQNASPVAVTFLFWTFDGSLAIVIFLSLVTGIIIGAVIALGARRKRRSLEQPSPPGPSSTGHF